MACFLLPKSLCAKLEGIMSKFWWQKGRGRKGIYWCAWKDLCHLKEDGGLGFRDLAKFNITLLAKQGCRLVYFPDSLLARVLKAKYYPNLNFYKARLGNLPLLTWKSVWSTRGLLEKGLCWRVGRGDQISVWDDLWISGNEVDKLKDHVNNGNIQLVSDLIEDSNRAWNSTVIFHTFKANVARKILQIPLAEIAHEDFQVWREQIIRHLSEWGGMKNEKRIFQPGESLQQDCQNGGVKIHFDAAFNHQNYKATSGLLVRDVEGEILASKSTIHTDIATPFAAEAHAGLDAIKLDRDKLAIGALIRDIQQKKNRFVEIGFHFIPKSKNTKAYEIAKQSLLREESFYLEKGVPDYIHQAWESKRPRFPD
ncbi:hypothetical protein J1N35_038646 [Gossypium stocksii]|uniref:RNase H type-1 domain-containing protein n=1 Tax=Gossypium stocksii TaxID=47602 RepID=A0A9D3UM97_9ROSI|nr:hypothetical protein J1N35_038646 [Gossypium stocksii]